MSATTAAASLPQLQISPPFRPVSRRRAAPPPPHRAAWTIRPAIAIALVILLVLASAGGVWFTNTRHDEPQRLLAPTVATPSPDASSDVPMYRGNPARTGVLPGPALQGDPVELWTLQTGEPVNLGAAVVDGVLYIPAGTQGFEARDAMTGDLLWAFPTDAPAVSAPAVAEGRGYVIDNDGTLYAVNTADGTEAWRMANLNIRSSVAPVDGLVYAVSPEGTFYALEAASGAISWQAELGAEAAGGMAVSDGMVYQGNAAGAMKTFDAKTGQMISTFQNEEGRGNATLTAANGHVYMTISGGDVNAMYAIDVVTGHVTWKRELGPGLGFISTTATPTMLYSVAEDGKLHAMDAATGETVWEYQLLEFVRSIPVLVEDTLYVADNGGFVRALDPATGEQQWEYPIEGEVDLGWPVVSNGVLYIGTSFGNFYAITGSGTSGAGGLATPAVVAAVTTATPVATAPASPEATTATSSTGQIGSFAWQVGGADGSLGKPDGLAVAPDGTLWIFDLATATLLQFGADGAPLDSIALNDVGAGEFNFAQPSGESYGALAIDADGNFYVLDMGNYRVVKLAPDGAYLLAWGKRGSTDGQISIPQDLAVSPDGSVYVLDGQRREVLRYTADGEFVTAFGREGEVGERLVHPNRFGVDPDGNVLVGHDSDIVVFSPDGTLVNRFGDGDLGRAGDVAVDQQGLIYVTDLVDNQVRVFDSSGVLIGTIGEPGSEPGQFVGLDAVAVDGTGGVYALDFEGQRVERFDLTLPSAATPAATPMASAFDPANATMLWETGEDANLGDGLFGAAVDANGVVYVVDSLANDIAMFGPDGAYLGRWGTGGVGPGEFRFSTQSYGGAVIDIDAEGNIYVFDAANHRVQKFDANRTFLTEWGSRGTGDGQFNVPMGTVDDASGRVYVAEYMNHRVQVFDLDGTFLAAWGEFGPDPGQLNGPAAIAVMPDGTVYVSEESNPRIQHFTADGEYLGELQQPDPGTGVVYGMAVDDSGNLWTASVNPRRVVAYAPDGTVLTAFDTLPEAGFLDTPVALAFDPDGNLVIVTVTGAGGEFTIDSGGQNRVLKVDLTPDAAVSSASPEATAATARIVWESDDAHAELSHAHQVTLAPDGTIWVADGANSRFQIFDQDGTLLEVWGADGVGEAEGQFNFVKSSNRDGLGGVAFAPDGSFYVMDTGNYRIQHFDAERNLLNTWGAFGGDEGQFISPFSIGIDSQGFVYVSDSQRHDIQKFDPEGAPILAIDVSVAGPQPPTAQGFIAMAPDDSIWLALPDNKRVLHFGSDGALLASIAYADIPGTPVWVQALAVDPQGRVYLPDTDGTRLFILDTDGSVLGPWSLTLADGTPNVNAGGMVVTDDGSIFLADWENGTLYRYELDPPLDAAAAAPAATPEATPAATTDNLATFLWETTGDPAQPLDRTSDVTVAPDGTIWVADGGHSQFQLFAPDGAYLESWGGAGQGTGDGQFDFVRPNSDGDSFGAVAFAPDGTFYVADMGNRRIQHFSADREFLNTWGGFGGEDGQFISPIDIAVDSQGNVFVDDDKREDVQKFAPDGTFLLSFGGGGSAPGQLDFQGWMAISPTDHVWVADAANGRIQEWDNNGQFLRAIDTTGMIQDPSSIAFDASGRMFVTDFSGIRVVVLDDTGTVVGEWGAPAGGDYRSFSQIALDGAGNAYVLSYFDSTLITFQLQPPLSEVNPIATPAT